MAEELLENDQLTDDHTGHKKLLLLVVRHYKKGNLGLAKTHSAYNTWRSAGFQSGNSCISIEISNLERIAA